MKLAVPIFRGRVSPAFDWACSVVLVEVDDGRPVEKTAFHFVSEPPPAKVAVLERLGVEVLLCGGISRPLASLAESRGIRVVPWLSGEIDEVVEAFAADRLTDEYFAMPGCRGGRRKGQRRCRARTGQGRGAGRGGTVEED